MNHPNQPTRRVTSLLLSAILILTALSLSSCGLLTGFQVNLLEELQERREELGTAQPAGNETDALEESETSPTPPASSDTTVQDYNIQISGSAAGDHTKAVSKMLLSAVSVVAKHQITYQYGGFFGSQTQTQQGAASGSGVIYQLDKASGDAYIITNHHVVYNENSDTEDGISDEIYVYLYGQESFLNLAQAGISYIGGEHDLYAIPVTYIGGSATYDIAVLKVEDSAILRSSQAAAVSVADSNVLAAGQPVFAVGNAQSFGISVTTGVVSVVSDTTMGTRFIRTDAAINSGNSGGGLFDTQGNLVGINDAKIASASVENIAYAIPSNVAVYAAQNLIDHYEAKGGSTVQKFLMGFTVQKTAFGTQYDTATGLVDTWETMKVSAIDEGSWAASTGLLVGDELLSVTVGGKLYPLDHAYELSDLLLTVREGDTVTLEVSRSGKTMTLSAGATAAHFGDPDVLSQ